MSGGHLQNIFLLSPPSNPRTLPAAWSNRVLTQAFSVLILFEIKKKKERETKMSYSSVHLTSHRSSRPRSVSQHCPCVRCVFFLASECISLMKKNVSWSRPRCRLDLSGSLRELEWACVVWSFFLAVDSSSTQRLKRSATRWRTANFPVAKLGTSGRRCLSEWNSFRQSSCFQATRAHATRILGTSIKVPKMFTKQKHQLFAVACKTANRSALWCRFSSRDRLGKQKENTLRKHVRWEHSAPF